MVQCKNALRCWSILNWWAVPFFSVFMKEKKKPSFIWICERFHSFSDSHSILFAVKSIVSSNWSGVNDHSIEYALTRSNKTNQCSVAHIYSRFSCLFWLSVLWCFRWFSFTVTMESVHFICQKVRFRFGLRTKCIQLSMRVLVTMSQFFQFHLSFHYGAFHSIGWHTVRTTILKFFFFWCVSKQRKNYSHNITTLQL